MNSNAAFDSQQTQFPRPFFGFDDSQLRPSSPEVSLVSDRARSTTKARNADKHVSSTKDRQKSAPPSRASKTSASSKSSKATTTDADKTELDLTLSQSPPLSPEVPRPNRRKRKRSLQALVTATAHGTLYTLVSMCTLSL